MRGGPQRIPRPDDWKLGDPAPWSGLSAAQRRPRVADVREVLAARGAGRASSDVVEHPRTSAVLAALFDEGNDTFVVLTRRSPHLRSHRWEVSFPGGRSEPDDPSHWHTALRESLEEVALEPGSVERIGELDRFVTVGSRSLVHPYVGALRERPALTPDPGEVEQILYVPLSELLDPEVYREERWRIGETERPITFFELHGNTVWGATAAMLRQLLTLVTATG